MYYFTIYVYKNKEQWTNSLFLYISSRVTRTSVPAIHQMFSSWGEEIRAHCAHWHTMNFNLIISYRKCFLLKCFCSGLKRWNLLHKLYCDMGIWMWKCHGQGPYLWWARGGISSGWLLSCAAVLCSNCLHSPLPHGLETQGDECPVSPKCYQ